jgi:hypothetical protein
MDATTSTPVAFWNAGNEVAVCLIVLAPPGFEAYDRSTTADKSRVARFGY